MTTLRLDDLIDGIRTTYPDQPLEQLTAAVLNAEHLHEISDHLIGHFVDQARRSGASWTEIGGCMGVTKQAAQQRFTPKADANMFTRFTPRCRTAVVAAQEEARAGQRAEIEPEHLLLGLLGQDGSRGVRALVEQGVDVATLRTAAEERLPGAPADGASPALIPFGASAKKTLELTLREAVRLGSEPIGTEHLLLALLAREAEAPGALHAAGVDAAAVERFVAADAS
jgi:hypothetical protein